MCLSGLGEKIWREEVTPTDDSTAEAPDPVKPRKSPKIIPIKKHVKSWCHLVILDRVNILENQMKFAMTRKKLGLYTKRVELREILQILQILIKATEKMARFI